jgi:hypothetical protein
VATAGLLALISLRGEVAANTANAGTVITQAQGVADRAAATAELAQADAEARHCVAGFMDDYYKKRTFDPWLRFTSDEDRDEFRRREAERQAAIEHAQREGTPKGDLEANKLAIAQLQDAAAHGATASPDYAGTLERLEAAKARLSAQLETSDPKKDAADRLADAGPAGRPSASLGSCWSAPHPAQSR